MIDWHGAIPDDNVYNIPCVCRCISIIVMFLSFLHLLHASYFIYPFFTIFFLIRLFLCLNFASIGFSIFFFLLSQIYHSKCLHESADSCFSSEILFCCAFLYFLCSFNLFFFIHAQAQCLCSFFFTFSRLSSLLLSVGNSTNSISFSTASILLYVGTTKLCFYSPKQL